MADVMRGAPAASDPRAQLMRVLVLRLWPFAVSTMLALVVYRVGVTILAAVSAALVASFLAYRFRVGAFLALMVSVLVPQLVQMVALLPDNWDALGGGVRISDLILVGMWGASAALLLSRAPRSRAERVFVGVSLGLALVLFVAVARNWGAYGLSALGEFRFRYLILGLPVFLALGLDSSNRRLVAARALAWAPIVGVLMMLPLVGALKGWGLGEASRFYPSAISLALLLAAIWIALSRRETPDGAVPGLAHSALAVVVLVILKDAHRSVWLVAGLSFVVLVWLRVIKVQRLWAWSLLVFSGGAITAALTSSGTSVLDYVVARGQAFIDPTSDPTSNWRLMVWKAYVATLRDNPLFGQGFGGYWDVYVPEFGTRVLTSPHSMYVQTLVKTGLAGMLALSGWFAASFRALLPRRPEVGAPINLGHVTLIMGVVATAASLAYGTVYALDFWPLAWMGLGLAEVFRSEAVVGT